MALAANTPTWLQRLRRIFPGRTVFDSRRVVSEIIGRTNLSQPQVSRARFRPRTIDQTVPDYEFYDHLRRGKASGYSLGGLFAKRIERVFAAWILGGGVVVELVEKAPIDDPEHPIVYTNVQLSEFINSMLDAGQDTEAETNLDSDDHQRSMLLSLFRDSIGLGDQYVIINADGSLSIPSPDTVDAEHSELDYRQLVKVTVTTKLNKYVITDEYRADGRTLTVKRGGQIVEQQEYENLIGRIPVVHIAYGMSGNETHGHPIHEELLALYDQYDDLIYKQIDGVKLFGTPILAVTGLEDVSKAYLDNRPLSEDTYTDKDGSVDTRAQIKLDTTSILLLGAGGDGKYIAPPTGFSEDTKTALKSLFLLLLDHTGIPEWIWGNEIASGRSSSEVQMAGFEKDIAGWRADTGGWIIRLCKIWLATAALVDRRIVYDRLRITWPEILSGDREILLKFIQFAKDNNLILDETALRLLDLVDNPQMEVEAAEAEADERRDQLFGDGINFGAQLNQAQTQAQTENGTEPMTA